MIWSLLLVPAVTGGLAFFLRSDGLRRSLLVLVAMVHAGLTAAVWLHPATPEADSWLAIDAASQLFLGITSLLFLVSSIYTVGYLRQEHSGEESRRPEPWWHPSREAAMTGCLLLFLATMTLVIVSRHLGLTWVAIEATTLASAPLIYFHRTPRSLEATWKYLVICSVGIALALLGNFFLAVSARIEGDGVVPLTIDSLLAHADQLRAVWLQGAFILLLVGYGTKMGLAPLHTWLPDAHSEAPSSISALLSGALLNCAFLAILRVYSVLASAGLGVFGQELLVAFGLISLAMAAVFILGQADFKRMLAYSSVEHMGILALGAGLGGLAGFGTMLHAVNHSLTKAMLFLAAGNILACFHTKSTHRAQGVLRVLPVTGVLWLAGFLAIGGSPPFGLFLSELTILQGALRAGCVWTAVGYLAGLAVIFVGMSSIVLKMVYAEPSPCSCCPEGEAMKPATPPANLREPLWSIAPPILLGLAVLILGVYIPPGLKELLGDAALAVGVGVGVK